MAKYMLFNYLPACTLLSAGDIVPPLQNVSAASDWTDGETTKKWQKFPSLVIYVEHISRGDVMDQFVWPVVIIALYLALQLWILPKFGIQT